MMIIHSSSAGKNKKDILTAKKNQEYKADDLINLPPRFSEGLADPNPGPKEWEEDRNTYGFSVRATNNGSMTQDTFYDYCLHFVKHLPENQGKTRSNQIEI